MRRKKLRIFAASVALVLCLQPVMSTVSQYTVYAANYLPDSLTESYVNKATEYFADISASFNQASSGQAGLLSRLDDLQQYAMVIYYLEEYKEDLDVQGRTVSGSELNEAVDDFLSMCKSFDNVYGKKSSTFTKMKLGYKKDDFKNDKTTKETLEKFCLTRVPNYLKKVLKKVKTETTGKKEDKLLADYGVMLSNVCSLLDNADDMMDNLTNISPYKSTSDIGSPIKFASKLNQPGAVAGLKKTYSTLLDAGEKVLAMQGSSSVISIDKSLEFVANMANVTAQDGSIVIPDGVQLSQAYLAILAAGATYVPFNSYVGESSFMAGLKSLVSDESAVADLVDFYDDTKNFRKPLYKRDLSNEGIPTGRAKLITVKDFLDEIEKGTEGALVTMAGKFTYDTKNNYWVYADTYSTNQDEDQIDEPTDDQDFSENADDSLEEGDVSADDAEQAIKDEQTTDGGSSGNSNSNTNTSAVTRSTNINNKGNKITIVYKSNAYKATYEFSVSTLKLTGQNLANGSKATSYSVLLTSGTNFGTYVSEAERHVDNKNSYLLSKDPQAKTFLQTTANGKNANIDAYKKLRIALKANENEQSSTSTSSGKKTDSIGDKIKNGIKNTGNFFKNLFSTSNEKTSKLFSPKIANAAQITESSSEQSTENSSEGSSEQSTENSSEKSTEQSTEKSSEKSSEDSTEDSSSTQVTVTEETSSTINTSEVSGMSVSGKDVPGIMADKTITSEDKMSEPILLYGTKHSRAADNMTTLLLRNIIKGTVGCKEKYNESNDYLYVNAYGDILTDDGMVILPGIANPIFYNSKSKYNPYTAAFMNNYPTVLENTNFFQVASENDIGKMVILNNSASLLKNGKLDPDSMITNKATAITTINDVKVTAPISVPEMETTFYYNNIQKKQLLGYDRLIFGDSSTWSEDGTGMYAYTPLLIKSQMSSGGVPIFPYNVEDDRNTKAGTTGDSAESYSCASLIAQNMFHYLTMDSSGTATNLGYLNDNYIVYYFCISNLNGTSNPLAYANADSYAYDRYVDDTEIRKESTLLQVSQRILKSLGGANQIIGITSATQDSILGPAFAFVKAHWLMCFMLLIVILLFAFARMRRDAFQSIVLLCICVGFAYAFVYIIPNYLPLAYNSVINNVSENLAYSIMGVKAESNDILKNDVAATNDDNGNYTTNTSSLTLYRVSSNKLQDFYNGLGITESDVVGGKTYIINQEAGLFVEGDKIKINTDVLFKTLEISGSYDADTANYHLEAAKTVSNNVDYYTPYYDMVNNFIDKLNSLATVYAIPRTMTKYSDDVLKDNYLVYSYTNSLPFLTPGVYNAYSPEDQSMLTKENLKALLENQDEVAAQLKQTFGDKDQAADWLGIVDFFYNLDSQYQDTVWAQTMYDNGYYYYDSKTKTDWKPNREKIIDLCNYVNTQTKKFVFSMGDQIGTLSDDVMIKIITLRELTAFTQYVSDMGHWLYPFSLNYQEMTMKDVLSTVLVSDYYTLVAQNLDICSYVLVKYGWFHLILLDALVILLFVICTILHFIVPLMYLLLGLLLVVKMVTNNDIKVPVRGYLKCTILAMLCSTVLCAGIVLTNKLHESVICIYFLIFVLLLVGTVLLTMLTSLITNIADFGDTSLKAKVEGMTNTFNNYRNAARSTTTNVFTSGTRNFRKNQNRESGIHSIVQRYNNNRSVDDFYDDYDTSSTYENVNNTDYDLDDDFDYSYEPTVTRSDGHDMN